MWGGGGGFGTAAGIILARQNVVFGRGTVRLVIAQVVMTAHGGRSMSRHDRARDTVAAVAADRRGHGQATVGSLDLRLLLLLFVLGRIRCGDVGGVVYMGWRVLLVLLQRQDTLTRLAGMYGVHEGGDFGVGRGGIRRCGEKEDVVHRRAHLPEPGRMPVARLCRRGGEVIGE